MATAGRGAGTRAAWTASRAVCRAVTRMRSAAAAEPRTTLPRAGFAASEPCAVAVAVPGARSVAVSSRPFRVLGLQQVAVGAESKDDMRKIWQDMLGLRKHGEFRSEKENVDEDILVMGRGLAEVEVDIMAPIDVTKSPKVHTPNLNHIGLWVDHLDACVEWLKANGVRFAGGIRVGAAGHKVAFIHPKGNAESPVGGAGVLIELVQAPSDVIKLYDAT